MSRTDTVYVRELLELTGSKDLYEDLGIDPARCSRVDLVTALERKRDWARRFPTDPVARWWTRHMIRIARLLVHDESRPKKKRHDDLDAAIKGVVLQGALTPESKRLLVRMGLRRGMTEAGIEERIEGEQQSLDALRNKMKTAPVPGPEVLVAGPDPKAEAKDAIRAASWGAMVAGNLSAGVAAKIVARGGELGLDEATVHTLLDEARAEWTAEGQQPEEIATPEPPLQAGPDEDEGRWIPPHRRTRARTEEDAHWTLDDSLEDGLEEVVRRALESSDGFEEIELDPSSIQTGHEERPYLPPSENSSLEIHVIERQQVQAPEREGVAPAAPEPDAAVPLDPSLLQGLSPVDDANAVAPPPRAKWRPFKTVAALFLHAAYSTVSIVGGAMYGIAWFVLAYRDHLQ